MIAPSLFFAVEMPWLYDANHTWTSEPILEVGQVTAFLQEPSHDACFYHIADVGRPDPGCPQVTLSGYRESRRS
jgi:hypothetical protein